MCQHLKRCRHLGRCRHVKVLTRADIPDTNHMDFLFANWDVLACVSTWKSADTWEGADTKVPTRADIPDTNHMDFLFANWDVLACVSTWKGADTWEGADTSRCRHVPTSQILIIWTFCLQTGMCWHVSAPEKVPTPKKVPTRLGADIPDTNHMDFLFANWDVLACVSTWKGADT